MKIVVSHPTGNRNVRAVLNAFEGSDKLERFMTTIATRSADGWLADRHFDLPRSKIQIHPIREILRLLFRRLPKNFLTAHETGPLCIDQVYQSLDLRVAAYCKKNTNIDAIYCYEDGALETFKTAKAHGIRCIYELPIAYGPYARELTRADIERRPDWAHTQIGISDSAAKMDRKREELALADTIIVPSDFVEGSIQQAIGTHQTVVKVPYGIDPPVKLQSVNEGPLGPKIKLLFVGALTQRKGLADIFSALKALPASSYEFHIVGGLCAPLKFYTNQGVNFTYHGMLSRDKVLSIMHGSDLLLLPSIVEGRALVQLEALAMGLPVLATRNAGASDVIKEGETGFIVPTGSPDSIVEVIQKLLSRPDQLPQMRRNCIATAQSNTWRIFEQQLVDRISENG
ncbi:MAG: glycosyltransferase family 4 protein [Opitutales bacterium]|nr:glycosyltransferase family 4 protein [Opitutales bacterium]